jgi:hypothetical protein
VIMKKRKETGTVDYAGLMMNTGILYALKYKFDDSLKFFTESKVIRDRPEYVKIVFA